MDYEAILFDMDGVLIDTHRSVTAFWQKYATSHQVHISPTDWTQHIYGCPARHTLDMLFPHISPAERQVIMEDMADYEANLTYTEIGGVTAFLRALNQNNVPTALVTSGDRWKVKEVTDQLGLTNAFTATITVNDIRRGKPDPECYLLAAKMLHKPPKNCIVFEDSISGVTAAVAAGALCIGIQSPARAAALVQAGAQDVVPDFTSVRLVVDQGNPRPVLRLQLGAESRLSLAVD